uniref:Uncharacterized protein n=1 Tax=Panagrolaimus davidi TaxID=227884 RepID=A0A914PX46_9BILA
MEVIIVEFDTKKFIYVNEFTNKNVKKFIDDIPKIFTKNFLSVFFQVCLFKPNGFKHNLEFCQILRDSFAALKIRTYFFSIPDYLYTHLFIATKTKIQLEEEVILLLDNPDKLNVFHCKLTKAGYEKEMIDNFVFDPKADVNVLRENIIRSTNPKKIIFATYKPKSKNTMLFKNQILKDFVVDVFDIRRLCEFDIQFLYEMTIWILNRLSGHIAKCLFMPKCARHYAVYFVSFETNPPSPIEILSVMPSEALPLFKAAYVGRTSHPRQVCLASIDPLTDEIHIIQELDLILNKCHATKVVLTIDSESFPTIKVESYILPEIFGMPNMLDETLKFKIPVIGIYGTPNFSVICYCKNDKSGYEFMKSWNWIYGNELSITFHNKKPVFGAAIHELKECNPSTVVYDLIKIMAMSPENVKVEKFWDFKITKDKENPILLEFDTFDGTRKRASPAFLMAMLIRQHLKAIEAEIGEKPNELGFCLFVNYSEEEMERIKSQIKESCNLLKISCVFI